MTIPHQSILFILVYFVSFFSDFDTRKWKATLTLFRRVTIRKITRTRIVLIIIIRIFAANFSRNQCMQLLYMHLWLPCMFIPWTNAWLFGYASWLRPPASARESALPILSAACITILQSLCRAHVGGSCRCAWLNITASDGHMTCHAELKTRVMKCFVFIASENLSPPVV